MGEQREHFCSAQGKKYGFIDWGFKGQIGAGEGRWQGHWRQKKHHVQSHGFQGKDVCFRKMQCVWSLECMVRNIHG